jgi:hypothetical protein
MGIKKPTGEKYNPKKIGIETFLLAGCNFFAKRQSHQAPPVTRDVLSQKNAVQNPNAQQ